jgi:hypothetical protein
MAVWGGLVVGARGVGSRAGRALGGNLQTKQTKQHSERKTKPKHKKNRMIRNYNQQERQKKPIHRNYIMP